MFISDKEKKISEQYLKQGYVIQDIEDMNSLDWIRDCHYKIISKVLPKLNGSNPKDILNKIHKYISEKGSVALDGVSLTVNEVKGSIFGVNIISHTKSFTTFGEKLKGDWTNLEIDMLARYVDRLLDRS